MSEHEPSSLFGGYFNVFLPSSSCIPPTHTNKSSTVPPSSQPSHRPSRNASRRRSSTPVLYCGSVDCCPVSSPLQSPLPYPSSPLPFRSSTSSEPDLPSNWPNTCIRRWRPPVCGRPRWQRRNYAVWIYN